MGTEDSDVDEIVYGMHPQQFVLLIALTANR